jgi:NAD(P)-dependent dehydrogenase (short-subunit alcohol dehydrogenase family)
MSFRLDGRVALVTGAASGIGRACALDLARAGARVVVSDLESAVALGGETVRLVAEAGGEARFVACDVSRGEDVRRLVEAAVAAYGRLDAAVNNAGVGGALAATADYTEEEWDRVMGVNLRGVWLCMKHEIPAMLKAGGGAIVNVASILGHVALAGAPAYTAAKHGVIGLTRVAAVDYAQQRVRVNAVCPAFIVTPMLERAGLLGDKIARRQIEARHPVNRMGQPEEVAGLVTWLCTDAASFVTGASYLVDGGYTAL